MDPGDMMMSVDIIPMIPASFYTQMESKKWSERKEALDIVEKATSVPKIMNADFGELTRVLKKAIAKDANIVVVASATKCMCQLAQGLRTNFSPYANSCLVTLFEKFKEKKPNVVSALRDATDAAFVGTNIESIYENIILLLDNKNPQIKGEMCLFLARTFSRFPEQVLNKKTLRPIINALIKTLSDMDATVRDNSATAIGTAMKVTGEKLMMTLIADVEPIKIPKIKESCEKAVIMTADDEVQNHHSNDDQENGQQASQATGTNGVEEDGEDEDEQAYEMLQAVDISAMIPDSFYTQMESKKWSERKEALDIVEKATSVPKIMNADFGELTRVLKKAIAKDANIVVVASATKCMCQLAQGLRTNFSPYANSCLMTIFEKFKEKKPHVVNLLRDASDAIFIGTNLESIYEDIIALLDNKNPQIKGEMCLFLARTFAKFPAQVLNKKTLRPIINALIKTLSDMDATVRDNSATAIGTAMKVTGEKLMMTLIADVEPIKIPKIKESCEKAQVKKVPQSAMSACTGSEPVPVAPQMNNHAPPSARSSSATMIRSSSSKKLAAKATITKPKTSTTPGSNATVKRTATIIKRSTVPKRAVGGQANPTSAQHALAMLPPPTHSLPAPAVVNQATPNKVGQTQGGFAPLQTLQQQHQSGLISTPAKPTFNTIHPPKLPSRQESLDLIIFKLISDDHDEVLSSLAELEESLEHVPKDRINQMIDLACLQLIKSFDGLRSTNSNANGTENIGSSKLIRSTEFLITVFAQRDLVSCASQQSIRYLLMQIFSLIQNCVNLRQDGAETIREKMNELASVVLDSSEPSNMMSILTGLLNEPSPISIMEQIKDAIIRSMRSFK